MINDIMLMSIVMEGFIWAVYIFFELWGTMENISCDYGNKYVMILIMRKLVK